MLEKVDVEGEGKELLTSFPKAMGLLAGYAVAYKRSKRRVSKICSTTSILYVCCKLPAKCVRPMY